MASRGHRVIACAQSLLPKDQFPSDHIFNKNDFPDTGYCFVGLVSLEDPPKHGVREAIGTLRLAGIKVMMVTGMFIIADPILKFILLEKVTIRKLPRPLPARST
jgi:hypothetical protein